MTFIIRGDDLQVFPFSLLHELGISDEYSSIGPVPHGLSTAVTGTQDSTASFGSPCEPPGYTNDIGSTQIGFPFKAQFNSFLANLLFGLPTSIDVSSTRMNKHPLVTKNKCGVYKPNPKYTLAVTITNIP